MSTTTINLGDEYDQKLLRALHKALKVLRARRIGYWFGIGGSQEVSNGVFKINGKIFKIETETYIGVTLTGEQDVVELIQKTVDRLMSK